MPRPSSRILIVDSDVDHIGDLGRFFANENYYLVSAKSGDEALDLAQQQSFDAVICEYRLEGLGGLALTAELQRMNSRIPVIVIAKNPGSNTAIEAIKAGAYDFLAKPVEPNEIQKVLSEAIAASRRMTNTVEIGASGADSTSDRDALIGKSRAMLEVYKSLGRLSATPVTVLVRGETGTGKELIARALYQHGHRAHKAFVTVNCAAIPENLLESELFGHEKGAFTGAVATRVGKFEQAHNATLFLDEIGDLDLSLQAKLLRVLQERQIERVGARDEIPVDVRIIAATHRNLEKMIADGEFREDLFYRLNVASIDLPPLRERMGDIPVLADYFLQRVGQELQLSRPAMTTRAIRYLDEQPWPGNVRQLQNVIRKALLNSRGFAIDRSDFQHVLSEGSSVNSGPSSGASESIRDLACEILNRVKIGEIEGAYGEMQTEMERVLFTEALREAGGNLSEVSRLLGVSRLTIREKLRKLGLRKD